MSNTQDIMSQISNLKAANKLNEALSVIQNRDDLRESANLANEYCHVLRRLGRQNDAIDFLCSISTEMLEKNRFLVSNLAASYREIGMFSHGWEVATNYLRQFPNEYSLYNEVFLCLLWGKKAERALIEARRYYEFSHNEHCVAHILMALIESNNISEVIDLISEKQSLALEPNQIRDVANFLESFGQSELALAFVVMALGDAELATSKNSLAVQNVLVRLCIRRGLAGRLLECFHNSNPGGSDMIFMAFSIFQNFSVPPERVSNFLDLCFYDRKDASPELLLLSIRLALYKEARNTWVNHGEEFLDRRKYEVFDFFRYLIHNEGWDLILLQIERIISILSDAGSYSQSMRTVFLNEIPRTKNTEVGQRVLFHISNVAFHYGEQTLSKRDEVAKRVFGGSWASVVSETDGAASKLALKSADWTLLFMIEDTPSVITKPMVDRGVLSARQTLREGRSISNAIVQRVIDFKFVPDFVTPSNKLNNTPQWVKIVQFWDSEEVPADVHDLISRSKKMNPNLQHLLFSDRTAADYIKERLPEILGFWQRCPKPAFRADMFRIVFIFFEGGVWLDIDEVAINSLSNLRSSYFSRLMISCMGEYYGGYYINNDFFISPPKHDLLQAVLSGLIQGVRDWGHADPLTVNYYERFGPGLWSRTVANMIEQQRPMHDVALLSRWSKEYFYRTVNLDYKSDPKRNWRIP